MSDYTIYHCPEQQKVGCTKDFTRRQKQYGEAKLWPLVVLEGATVKEAADEEWWWADFYQYKRGRNYACSAEGIGGKIGGKITGRKNVESGHLASIRTFENQSKGGRKNVESGHLASIRTFENQSKSGKSGGTATKGMKWFNNGILATKASICPEGFVPGYLSRAAKGKKHFNNGLIATMAFICPDGFVPGRLKRAA